MSELRTTLENISRGQEELCQMLKYGTPSSKQNTEMSATHQQVPVIHSQSVGPSQAKNEVVTLHGGVKIPAKTKNAALRGEFINLAEFLLYSETPSCNELEPFMNNGNVTFRQKKTRKVIHSFSRWLNAWSNYERLLVSNMPELYLCMLEYRQLIQSCDLKYQWSAVHAYDCRFRAKLGETCSFQFNSVQNDLFVIIFDATAVKRNIRACHRCKSLDHLANNCPFPPSNTLEEKKMPAKSKGESFFHQGVEICNNYQSGRCRFPSCRRAHVCQKCRGQTPSSDAQTVKEVTLVEQPVVYPKLNFNAIKDGLEDHPDKVYVRRILDYVSNDVPIGYTGPMQYREHKNWPSSYQYSKAVTESIIKGKEQSFFSNNFIVLNHIQIRFITIYDGCLT